MLMKRNLMIALIFSLSLFTFSAPAANAEGNEYKTVIKHLKTKYRAKKVKIPFMWLARFAVKVVRPAGVQSFSVALFEDLQFSRASLDEEMRNALRNSFGAEWSPILRVRSSEGEQVYAYMREAGKSVELTLVTINKNQAAVVRAKFSPEKFAEFINDPKIFGISLNDDNRTAKNKDSPTKEDLI